MPDDVEGLRAEADSLASRLRRLQAFAVNLLTATSVNQVADVVLEACVAAANAQIASVWSVKPDGAWLLATTHPGDHEKYQRVPTEPPNPVAVALALGEPVWLESRAEFAAQFPAMEVVTRTLDGSAPEAFACLPLKARGHVLGAVVLAFSEPRRFDPAEREFLGLLAMHATTALDHARLHAAQAATARRLAKLQEATAALTMARTPDEVAAVTVRLGSEAVDADGAALWLRNAEGGLDLASSHQIPEDYVAAWRTIPAGAPMPGLRVLTSMIAMWVETAEDYAHLAPEVYETARAANRVNAFAALPLVVAGLGAGVVTFSYDGAHQFPDEDRAFLTALARTCEQSLERALLYVAEAAARQAAERTSQAKDEFLAMLGHELRNPLATIVAAIEVKRLDDRPDRVVEIIDRHVQHLVRLVDDLLDVSRITRGKIQLQRAPVDLQLAVAEAVDAVRPQIDARRHLLDIRVTPVVVDADRDRLTQVLVNLLTNAAKYTPPGGAIELGVTIENADARISVKDTGSGIPAPLLERMFEPFVQGDRAVDRTEGGLGLGLAIVKNVVELHGGRVQAFSAGPGRGATFTVWWPRMLTAAAAPTR